jgi:hypothetical protein
MKKKADSPCASPECSNLLWAMAENESGPAASPTGLQRRRALALLLMALPAAKLQAGSSLGTESLVAHRWILKAEDI